MSNAGQKQLRLVQSSVYTLSDLVRGISNLSAGAPERSLPGADVMEFDIRRAIESAATYVERRAKERGIEISCDIAAEMPAMVCGNGAQFRQMLLYVLHGAIKLASEGQMQIHATLGALEDESFAMRVEIAFNGGEAIRDVWADAAFARDAAEVVDESIAAGKGVLSLLIARRLIEQLGGRFGIETTDEPKASFWFTLKWMRGGQGGNRRVHNRFAVESVKSNLGDVLDLSLGGAKILAKRKPKKQIDLQLGDGELTVTVSANVCRVERRGWRKYEIGVEFIDLSPRAMEVIRRISIQNRVLRHVFES